MNRKLVLRCLLTLTAMLLLAAQLSACSLTGMTKEEKINLTIVYWSDESFEQQFGSSWVKAHPNISVQVLSMTSLQSADDRKKAMNESSPDVLLLSRDEYRKKAAEGELTDLATYMATDRYKLDGWYRSIEQQLRADGEGILYGLAPSFYSNSLFYNRELFQKAGVPEPTDGMTWEDTFALAKRVAQSTPGVYGLIEPFTASGQPYSLFTAIGSSKGLADIQPASQSVPLRSPPWTAVANMLRDAVQSKALYVGETTGRGDNPFLAGKAAMGLFGNYLLTELSNSSSTALKDQIGIVTVPIDSSYPDATPLATVGPIFAVQSSSKHPQEAWELIRHIADTTMTSDPLLTTGNGLPAVMPTPDNIAGIAFGPFYKLQMLEPSQGRELLPPSFMGQFLPSANETLSAILAGERPAEEALQALSVQGEALLKNPGT